MTQIKKEKKHEKLKQIKMKKKKEKKRIKKKKKKKKKKRIKKMCAELSPSVDLWMSSVSTLHGVLDVFVWAHVLFTRTVLEPNGSTINTQDHGCLHVHMYKED